MANKLMTPTQQEKLDGMPQVFIAKASEDSNITSENEIDLLSLQLSAGMYQIELFIKIDMDKRAGAFINLATKVGGEPTPLGAIEADITVADKDPNNYIEKNEWIWDVTGTGNVFEVTNSGTTSIVYDLITRATGVVNFDDTTTLYFQSALCEDSYADVNVFNSAYSYIKATKLD